MKKISFKKRRCEYSKCQKWFTPIPNATGKSNQKYCSTAHKNLGWQEQKLNRLIEEKAQEIVKRATVAV